MLKYKKKKGFTIIELIVVMAIIGVLVLLAVPKFMNHTQQARLTQIKSDTKQLENASERYYMDKNDWPRISDIPYTSAQITTFAQEVTDKTGQVVTLDSSGSYYDVDYTKLQQYIQKQKNDIHYIIQNPVGEIYHLGKLTTIGEERLNPPEIINNKPIAVITMTPGIAITTNTNITWSYGNSTDDDGDTIINAEWQGSQNIYTTAGTYTVNLRVKDSKGLWSDWVSSTFSVSSIPTKTIETIVNGVLPANISSITASSVATWDGLLYSHWLAFDGKYDVMNNGWMSTDQSNAWLQVTFKASQNISMVKMVNSSNIYRIGEYRCKDFRVEYLDETTSTWKIALASSMADKPGLQTFTMASVGSHKSWRFFIVNHGYSTSAYLGIGEIQFLN